MSLLSSTLKILSVVTLLSCGSGHNYSSSLTLEEDDDCYEVDDFTCAVEHEIIRLTNEYRGDLAAMTYGRRTAFSSRQWSKEQGNRGYIGHEGFTGQRYQTIRDHFQSVDGVTLQAENVAMASGLSVDDPTAVAERFARMWWNSAGHRRNMLGRYGTIGVGVWTNGRGTYYATQIFGEES